MPRGSLGPVHTHHRGLAIQKDAYLAWVATLPGGTIIARGRTIRACKEALDSYLGTLPQDNPLRRLDEPNT